MRGQSENEAMLAGMGFLAKKQWEVAENEFGRRVWAGLGVAFILHL